MHGLERPEPTQEEWRLQLGLTETDHQRSVVLQEIIDDLQFGLLVQTSDIEGDEYQLLPLRFHFREISFDPRSVYIGECISPVFSVIRSTPTVTLVFVLGLLLPSCYLVFHTLGGSSPTVTIGFWFGHLVLLPQSLGCPSSFVSHWSQLKSQGHLFSVAIFVALEFHDVPYLSC